jgi:ornithine carbamoyltransferase
MDGATQEHIKEAAPVISQYCDVIGVRSSELITKGSQVAGSSADWAEAKKDTVVRSFARYATVPVIIDAVTRDGTKQRFTGTYTLRRAMVDGATPEQRRWRIYSARLRTR